MSSDPFRLDGKKALITGASGGIGAAIARVLHAQGATVALSGTRVDVLVDLAKSLGDKRAHVCPGNLSEADAAAVLVARAEAAMGGLDILVSNAGVTKDGLALRMSDADFESILALDLTAPFRLARAALRVMLRNRAGRIINIGSIVGATGNPGQANYVAAKAGLAGLTKALAQEVASRGVTVNLIAPGFIATPMTEALTDAQRAALLARIPLGRMGVPEDVAFAVAYLASDAGAWITGATMHVNGGMAML
jgi:3-oxoacyl-[acyl-carrier protein] reductase